MSAIASRSSYRVADEQEWLQSSVNVDPSPASVWAPDYEEEDETTLQAARVDVQYTNLMSPDIEKEESVVDTPRQVRLLDESQVLPGEASFATVRLNQPVEESSFKSPNSREPISTGDIEEHRERRSASRVQLLDESRILAGEASFATVMSGEGMKAQRHSPITEFLVKTKLSLKQLMLAVLALLSVLAVGVFVLVITMSSEVVKVSSAPPPIIPVATNQSVAPSNTEPPASVLNSQAKESGTASSTQALATAKETESVATTKLIETRSSDDSRKAPADAKSVTVSQEILREPKEHVIETKKQSASAARKALKEPAVVKTPNATVRSEPSETRSEPATRESEVPVTVEKVETKTPTITGGGERPRTVTRKPNP